MPEISRDPFYRRHRFPAEIIAHAVWLYFRFPLSLRMVEDMLAARGIIVSHQTIKSTSWCKAAEMPRLHGT
jgi:putative transposase